MILPFDCFVFTLRRKIKVGKRRNPSFQKMGKGDRILCLLIDGEPMADDLAHSKGKGMPSSGCSKENRRQR